MSPHVQILYAAILIIKVNVVNCVCAFLLITFAAYAGLLHGVWCLSKIVFGDYKSIKLSAL